MKKCNCCGKEYVSVPTGGKTNSLGYWFNCECGSTLLFRKVFK